MRFNQLVETEPAEQVVLFLERYLQETPASEVDWVLVSRAHLAAGDAGGCWMRRWIAALPPGQDSSRRSSDRISALNDYTLAQVAKSDGQKALEDLATTLSRERQGHSWCALLQGADRPVSIYHPEGEYLKGLLLYVE